MFEIGYLIGIAIGLGLLIWLAIRSLRRRRDIKEGKVKKSFWRDF